MTVAYLIGAAAFCVLIYRMIRSGYPGMRYLLYFAGCLLGGTILYSSDVIGLFAGCGLVRTLITPAGDDLRILALSFQLLFVGAVRDSINPRRKRLLMAWTLAVVLFLAGMVALAQPHSIGSFLIPAPGRAAALVVYKVVFIAFGALNLLVFTLVMGSSARRATGVLRYGLFLIAGSGIAGICWTACTIADIVGIVTTGRFDMADNQLSTILGTTTITLGTAGAMLGLWHANLGVAIRSRQVRRDYVRLEPLWTLVSATSPGVVLEPRLLTRGRNAEFALYRRVIEIRDGYLSLRDYLPADVSAPDGEQPTAAEEAAMIVAAARAHRAGRRSVLADRLPLTRIEPTIEGEVAWLGQVADALNAPGHRPSPPHDQADGAGPAGSWSTWAGSWST